MPTLASMLIGWFPSLPMLPLAATEETWIYGVVLTSVLALGIGAQWLGWRLRIPSILLLLIIGFIAGPVMKWVTDGQVFLNVGRVMNDDLLLSLVSLAVGLILFEGGLTLNFGEIRTVRRAVLNLVTVGALVTGVIAAIAGHYVLGLNWSVALVLGAILTVTGPTVIGPLLRFIRPTGSVGKVLKWEGIVIDPIGALLTVLVFEAVIAGQGVDRTAMAFISNALKASVIGSLAGFGAAAALVALLKRFLIPDYLQVPVALALAALAFTSTNLFVPESGLFATTIMGIALANQKRVRIAHIVEFKETLTTLLIAMLFIALSARLQLAELSQINVWGFLGFFAILILIARPASVVASTFGTKLGWREKLFMCCMAPRGIVAAAVSSVFGLALFQRDVPQAELLAPYVFLTIVATVAVYGLTAPFVARRLELADPENAGFLIVGANDIARAVAKALHDEKVEVLVVDLNYQNIQKTRLMGIPTLVANILSPQVQEHIELTGIGRLLALTPNNDINSLAAVQFGRHFGRSNVYQLAHESERARQRAREKGESGSKKTDVDTEVRGRVLFGSTATYDELEERLAIGAKVRKTKLTKEFTLKHWQDKYGREAVPLFLVDDAGAIQVFAADKPLTPKAGQAIMSLTLARPEEPAAPVPPQILVSEAPTPAAETIAVPSA